MLKMIKRNNYLFFICLFVFAFLLQLNVVNILVQNNKLIFTDISSSGVISVVLAISTVFVSYFRFFVIKNRVVRLTPELYWPFILSTFLLVLKSNDAAFSLLFATLAAIVGYFFGRYLTKLKTNKSKNKKGHP